MTGHVIYNPAYTGNWKTETEKRPTENHLEGENMILVFGGNAGGRLLLSDPPNTTPWLFNGCILMRFGLVNVLSTN